MKDLVRQFIEAMGWSDRQWLFFWVVLAVLILLPIAMMLFGWKLSSLNDVLIWLTGVVVLVYTIETQGLRFEMVRQNELAVRPFLILGVKGNKWQHQIVLKNIGKGAAIFVRIEDVRLGKRDDIMSGRARQLVAAYPEGIVFTLESEVEKNEKNDAWLPVYERVKGT